MITIERFTEILDELFEEVPEDILKGLNLGVAVSEEVKVHHKAVNDDLIILGQYKRSGMGKGIVIYYGSFMRLYPHYREDQLRERMRQILYHELRHHMEYRANNKDLEVEDELFLARYEERKHKIENIDVEEE